MAVSIIPGSCALTACLNISPTVGLGITGYACSGLGYTLNSGCLSEKVQYCLEITQLLLFRQGQVRPGLTQMGCENTGSQFARLAQGGAGGGR